MDEAKLIAENWDWLQAISRTLNRRYCERCRSADYDDCFQEAALALIDVARSSAQGVLDEDDWYRFVYNAAKYRVFRLLGLRVKRDWEGDRTEYKDALPLAASMDAPIDGSDLTMMGALPSPRDVIEEAEARIDREIAVRRLSEAVRKLPEDMRTIIGRYHTGQTIMAMARQMGIDKGAARRLEKRALRMLARDPLLSGIGTVTLRRRRAVRGMLWEVCDTETV